MKVFTTGQAAKICKVAPRTVSKWFDSGRLKGYRIPGSEDRRIPQEYLIRFLKEHGMPLGDLENEGATKVLLISNDELLVTSLKQALPSDDVCKFATAKTGFEAGIQVEAAQPHCIVVDFAIGRDEALKLCQFLRDNSAYERFSLIALIDGKRTDGDAAQCCNEIFSKPFDAALLAERVGSLAGMKKMSA